MGVQSERDGKRGIACIFMNNANIMIAYSGEYRDVVPDVIRKYSHAQNPACDLNTDAGENSYSIASEKILSLLPVQRFDLKQVINESTAI